MFKQAITTLLITTLWLISGFKSAPNEKWIAYLKLEGMGKFYELKSDAVYGGYNPIDKKYFLFGKTHMFSSSDAEAQKVFSDFCELNSAGQFEFQVFGAQNDKVPAQPTQLKGSLNMGKITSGMAQIKKSGNSGKEISFQGDFKSMGFYFSDEAKKLINGKFTLSIVSTKK